MHDLLVMHVRQAARNGKNKAFHHTDVKWALLRFYPFVEECVQVKVHELGDDDRAIAGNASVKQLKDVYVALNLHSCIISCPINELRQFDLLANPNAQQHYKLTTT